MPTPLFGAAEVVDTAGSCGTAELRAGGQAKAPG